MTPSAAKPRTLSTADERRDAVLAAGRTVFAERGIHGTPTMAVAKAAGISQAYLFRLFPTKTDLAVAVVQDGCHHLHRTFAQAAARAKAEGLTGEDVRHAMGMAYVELIADRETLLLQMHAHAAAASMPEIRDVMRWSFAELHAMLVRETGASDSEIGSFLATGMMLNVLGALDAFELDEPWAQAAMCVATDDDPV